MAHFAQIDKNNTVLQVIVVKNTELLDENGHEQESKGKEFCASLLGGTWVQTSYNSTFRKNFAGSGCVYDDQRSAFITPKPFESWILNEDTCPWNSPVAYPNDSLTYQWDEILQSWTVTNT